MAVLALTALIVAASLAPASGAEGLTAPPEAGVGKLDLPLGGEPPPPPADLALEYERDGRDYAPSSLGVWGERASMREWVRENLNAGSALHAPLLRGRDVHMALLYPFDLGRPHLRAAPAGVLFRFRL